MVYSRIQAANFRTLHQSSIINLYTVCLSLHSHSSLKVHSYNCHIHSIVIFTWLHKDIAQSDCTRDTTRWQSICWGSSLVSAFWWFWRRLRQKLGSLNMALTALKDFARAGGNWTSWATLLLKCWTLNTPTWVQCV